MRYLGTKEISERLRLSRRTIQKWCMSGKIAGIRQISGRFYIPVSALNDWLKKHDINKSEDDI